MWKRLLLLAVVGFGFYTWWTGRPVAHAPGVVVSAAPVQEDISGASPFAYKDYTVTPLARFALEARVLAKEAYRLDREANLAPVDLALGWGRMSDEAVLGRLSIGQSRPLFLAGRGVPDPQERDRDQQRQHAHHSRGRRRGQAPARHPQGERGEDTRLSGAGGCEGRLALEKLAHPQRHRPRRLRTDMGRRHFGELAGSRPAVADLRRVRLEMPPFPVPGISGTSEVEAKLERRPC